MNLLDASLDFIATSPVAHLGHVTSRVWGVWVKGSWPTTVGNGPLVWGLARVQMMARGPHDGLDGE